MASTPFKSLRWAMLLYAVVGLIVACANLCFLMTYAEVKFGPVVNIAAYLLIIGGILCAKFKNALYSAVVGFVLISCVNATVAYDLITYNPYNAVQQESTPSNSSVAEEQEQRETAAKPQSKSSIVGTYSLTELTNTVWTITIKEDNTCVFRREDIGKDHYGTCEYFTYDDCPYYILELSGPIKLMLPSSEVIGGRFYYMDKSGEWLYKNSTALKAKDPTARFSLTRK